jgi:hypothetical protein
MESKSRLQLRIATGFSIFLIGPLISVIFISFDFAPTSQLEGPCSSSDTNLCMLISWHWTNSINRSEQQPIETLEWEDWCSGRQCFLCANPRTLYSSCSRAWAFRIPKSWRSGYQVCGNVRPVYTELNAGFQLGIRQGARSFQLRDGSIKQNHNF